MTADWNKVFKDRPMVNDAAVEAVIKPVAYWLRARYPDPAKLKVLDVGCGGGATLAWFQARGVKIYGIDVAKEAVALARKRLGKSAQIRTASADKLPFPRGYFDIVTEANVIQHMSKQARAKAYSEIARVLKRNGLFVGYSLAISDSVYSKYYFEASLPGEPGSLALSQPGRLGTLPTIGLTHFFTESEFAALLPGFDLEMLPVSFQLPSHEARRRGFGDWPYVNNFFVVHGVKR